MRKNALAGFILAVALSLSLMACEDTKARQENEQLKAQASELQKQNGELKNSVDVLTKENAALKEENEQLKAKHARTKIPKAKRHHRTSRQAPSNQN
jgi:regulator of replication initiation timing